jgi:hypothetical protein
VDRRGVERLLVRGRIGEPVPLAGYSPGVDVAVAAFAGDLVARELLLDDGPVVKAMSSSTSAGTTPGRYGGTSPAA